MPHTISVKFRQPISQTVRPYFLVWCFIYTSKQNPKDFLQEK